MIETKEKYKDYEIHIIEKDNLKELIIGVNKQKEKRILNTISLTLRVKG